MRIRLADIPDIPKIVEISEELRVKSSYSDVPMDKRFYKQTIAQLISTKTGVVFVVVDDQNEPQGFLLGVIDQYFFSDKWYATDIALYVRESHKSMTVFLIKRFIKWAKRFPKVIKIMMAISSGIESNLGEIYQRLGMECMGGGFYVMRIER